MKDAWTSTALPILQTVADRERQGGQAATAEVLRLAADPEVALQLAALLEDGYLAGATPHWPLGAGRPNIVADVLRLTPKGRRAVGQWPSGQSGEILIRTLEATVEDLPEGENKSRLGRVLSAAREVSTDVLSEVMAKVISKQLGLPP